MAASSGTSSSSTGRSGIIVAKIGSSSLVTNGAINQAALDKLCAEVATVNAGGKSVVLVSSGAIAVGLPALGFGPDERPKDPAVLRAASAVGQQSLMRAWEAALAGQGLIGGQVLLAPTDLMMRRRYLKSRGTLGALLHLGVVPIINENDAIADDEIRFGDNDRLAALVAHLVEAELLVLLTDTPGLFTADPRHDASASLIEEIVAIDQELEAIAGGAGSANGTGGMASKLAAARIAGWSGIETIIAGADTADVLVNAVGGDAGVGTTFRARESRLSARKLWIAFALPASGTIVVDAGARAALEGNNRSLLPAGVVDCIGDFGVEDAVEIVDQQGTVFAKGLARWSSEALRDHYGKRTSEVPDDLVDEVVHRDDLIMLP